jgi:hypothetical protein
MDICPVKVFCDTRFFYPQKPTGASSAVIICQAGFLRLAAGFLRIAFDAGTNNVFQYRQPAAVARNDIIQV